MCAVWCVCGVRVCGVRGVHRRRRLLDLRCQLTIIFSNDSPLSSCFLHVVPNLNSKRVEDRKAAWHMSFLDS